MADDLKRPIAPASPSPKALRDPFYAATWRAYGDPEILAAAGFFEDGLDGGVDALQTSAPDWMATPFHKLRAATGEHPVVLLTTGAFSPVHDGHLALLAAARETLESAGYDVIGGYLSPSHDAYVSTKDGGRAALPAAHRVTLCEAAVAASDWLMVDPWEARHLPRAINFTDVIRRLEAYLRARVSDRTRVAYVFGSDNAGFARAFVEHGLAVCVRRPGHEAAFEAVRSDPRLRGRVFFRSEGTPDASSSRIRRGADDHLPEGVGAIYRRWRSGEVDGEPIARIAPYLVRDDLVRSAGFLFRGRQHRTVAAALAAFREEILGALERAFANAKEPDPRIRIRLRTARPETQTTAGLERAGDLPVISLDPHLEGHHTLAVSRAFALADAQASPLGLVARPGFPSLDSQIDAIPPGEYALVEDDSASGFTLRAVRALLPEGVRVVREILLAGLAGDTADLHDVVDFRDFLVGARHGGLVVKLAGGALVRAPYAEPYVSLRSRARIPPSSERALSLAIWAANQRLFEALAPAPLIAHADPALRALARSCGFRARDPLATFCLWHRQRLSLGSG